MTVIRRSASSRSSLRSSYRRWKAAACQAAPFSLDQARGSAPAAWTGTTGPRTLFVTNRQVTASENVTAVRSYDAVSHLATWEEHCRRRELAVPLDADGRPCLRGAGMKVLPDASDEIPPACKLAPVKHVRLRLVDHRLRDVLRPHEAEGAARAHLRLCPGEAIVAVAEHYAKNPPPAAFRSARLRWIEVPMRRVTIKRITPLITYEVAER